MKKMIETKADTEIIACLDAKQSFSMIAGAGSGKTTSLIGALKNLRNREGDRLRRDDKKIVCITYTNRAVKVISNRLNWDDLFRISTLHKFLWDEIQRFSPNIRDAVRDCVIPKRIENKRKDDNRGNSKKAIAAREKIASLEADLAVLDSVDKFDYNDTNFSNYSDGKLNHDDVIDAASHMIFENQILRRVISQKYSYIFVDEAQDTFDNVVEALNRLCENENLPIIGYFGDPMQQIYDKRAGDFGGPAGAKTITKEENFRSSCSVIKFLNSFRKDVQQFPAGENRNIEGSVQIRLVQAEEPGAPRKRYTEDQIDRASLRFDEALESWGWSKNDNVKRLFLVRQMIARRLGFSKFQKLFTGQFASSKAQEDYEKGEHFLLKPFVKTVSPLVQGHRENDQRKVIDVLRKSSPAFDPKGKNAQRTLKEMRDRANIISSELSELWKDASLKEILKFCRKEEVCEISDRLSESLDRVPRNEDYESALHSSDKGEWLADQFFQMTSIEIMAYADFVSENTPLSTQHGVKGEQYENVLVVFDDVEAAWNNYSFTKTLTPNTSGNPTDGQLDKSTKLAYVCFSRAEENLRILLFSPNPATAKQELIDNGLFEVDQISIAN